MAKSNLWTLLLVLIPAFAACTKDGNTIYQTNPDEEKPSTALGSHVGIYNYTNFGNLYTTSPKDFFVKR
jgi:hypothetical protein